MGKNNMIDSGNLADDRLYDALDKLYHRGWVDHYKGRDYDSRGTIDWQAVLDLHREEVTSLMEEIIKYQQEVIRLREKIISEGLYVK